MLHLLRCFIPFRPLNAWRSYRLVERDSLLVKLDHSKLKTSRVCNGKQLHLHAQLCTYGVASSTNTNSEAPLAREWRQFAVKFTMSRVRRLWHTCKVS